MYKFLFKLTTWAIGRLFLIAVILTIGAYGFYKFEHSWQGRAIVTSAEHPHPIKEKEKVVVDDSKKIEKKASALAKEAEHESAKLAKATTQATTRESHKIHDEFRSFIAKIPHPHLFKKKTPTTRPTTQPSAHTLFSQERGVVFISLKLV